MTASERIRKAREAKPACADCGTRGNVCRDGDGVDRCRGCSRVAWMAALGSPIPKPAPLMQECRDCGDSFPYSEDADICPECVAEMHPYGRI
jgi:hypothetical protein